MEFRLPHVFYGVKWMTWVTQVPFCPYPEHKVIVARIR